MLRRKAFKFKLKTDPEIEQQLSRLAGCTRYVWNRMLADQKARLDRGEYVLSYEAMCDELKRWKDEPESSFLKEADSQALQQKLKDLRRAFDNFFNPELKREFPKFKKKHRKNSFRYPQRSTVDNRRIYLPKIGWVGFHKSRDIEGKIKNVTVEKKVGKWFVSIQTEMNVNAPECASCSAVGGDLGVREFLATSDGETYPGIDAFRKAQSKLAKLQRQLSRKAKFSKNWRKIKEKISLLHARIANIREDRLQKLSTDLSKTHALVVLEDLNVSGMSASAKGTIENPGKNVKQKAGLNKSILDQGWGTFGRLLEDKLEWNGARLLRVPPQYTSQECSACGYTAQENRKTVDLFVCRECGHTKNAHTNAADNILRRGIDILALEDPLFLNILELP